MGALFPKGFQTTYNFDPILSSSIQFNDGSSYSFRYDKYGEIARVNLPTGGAIEYDYGEGYNGSGDGFEGSSTDANPVMIYRRLQERREYANGGSTYTLRTHYTVTYANSQTTDTAIAYDGSGKVLTQTVHTINGSPTDALRITGIGCNSWNEGVEARTVYGVAPQQVQVDRTLSPQSGCMSNPQVVTQTTTLLDTNQVSQTTYSYDRYGNVFEEDDYDWGPSAPGALLRKTQTSYLWSNNGVYSTPSINLVRAPSSSTIYDGGGNQIAASSWHYDEGALQDAAVIGHDTNYGTGFTLRGNVTSVWRWWNTRNNYVGSVMTYDVAGNVVALTDPNGQVTRFNYNDDGSGQYAFPTSTFTPQNLATSATYDYYIGKPVSTTDRNSHATTYTYNDALDRLTLINQPNGGAISFSYPNPNVVIQRQD